MLATLGLDSTAEAVYRAMLAFPREGVKALGDRLGVPEDDVRRSLDTLSELALIRPSYERAGELRAVTPEVGMEILMARQQAELAAQQLRIEASRAAAAQLIAEYADLSPTATASPGVEQLVGLDEIRSRISGLAHGLRTELMSFAPGGGHQPQTLEASKPNDRALLGRGVRMRSLFQDSVRNSQPTVAYATWLSELGGEVRTAPDLPTRLMIFDRTSAVIPISSEDSGAGAVILTGQGTLTALCALFENVWAGAQPLGVAQERDEGTLSAQESTVIRLLAQGLTDEAIAKRLAVSPRTARRLANGLMERLGAASRFEFGVRAVQRGWLPSTS
ncbi:helix-turn-helix transcriptional regulator [Streptomyces sp. NPDC054904]|uniref:helix-turn-helix transcriptional regulator n=1 Tax=unclassified Streptomyces TaxID=2593676 RepID=UPI002481CCDA|nr:MULTISPECIES: helix-turn-helix transcriptional regulator [unclassified Streptomyces]MDA5283924.1 helix-turn-helix transcriptional regulator [Streptomyces sp. Isolate_45]MDX2396201.1 helix-turn-helix transcriptional regulator [Streptomyces sp. DK15]